MLKNIELRDYQKEAIDFVKNKERCLINLPIGSGKSIASIAAVLEMNNGNKGKNLIICPNSLKYHWKEQLENFTDSSFAVVEGDFTKRVKAYEKLLNNSLDFLIVNYEVFRNPKDQNILFNIYYDSIIADEVTKIKNFKSQINKALCKLMANIKVGLSGSPIENRLNELWAILRFINPAIWPNYWSFRNRYMIYEKRKFGNKEFFELVGYKNLEEIRRKLPDFMFKKERDEIMKELPPRIEKIFLVELLPEQRNIYDLVKKEILNLIDIGDKMNTLAKITYLREVCNDPRTINLDKKGNKIKVLKEILSDINLSESNVLIFSEFKKFVNLIADELLKENYKVITLTGDDDSKDLDEKVKRFNEENNLILVSTDVGTYGLNLQNKCNIIINATLPWNPIKVEQRIGRIYRLGQNNKVVIINLLAKDTIEERVWKINREKLQLIANTIGIEPSNMTIEDDIEKIKTLL